ncbi:HupE/UreJ family protein [Flavobacterium sp. 20NA77.7]|uniref:HupE/UreJ family protein n=1 Tax=Flavobacterium nakdongensis TaxID=3073563 RepID=A0ABY9RA99_9FLAO|nr:HupE/UreJ family protein [Flavobacterium sp. 20NA77.7]WMW78153.1 HupE/UreJ family protein [Flavobacterium sp. 20NA77.7]
MDAFFIYVNMGINHVLDIKGHDHVLFLLALISPYAFKDWKRILFLVSIFTVGHTLALVLSVYNVVSVKASLVEFLIPVTILITALFALFTAGKTTKKESVTFVAGVTLFFGLIHGLGFSNYFKTIMIGTPSEKVLPLMEFALGIEVAQLIVVIIGLILAYIAQAVFKFSKREWGLIIASFIIGAVVPMLIENEIWYS